MAEFNCGGCTGTPKAHAERQLKMLLIASKLLKKDGILLYSTCALSELENDAVGAQEQHCSYAIVNVQIVTSIARIKNGCNQFEGAEV